MGASQTSEKDYAEYCCWLQYERNPKVKRAFFTNINVSEYSKTDVTQTAVEELYRGLSAIVGTPPAINQRQTSAIVLATINSPELPAEIDVAQLSSQLNEEGFCIRMDNKEECLYLIGKTDKGILYAVFHLLRMLQTCTNINMETIENPTNEFRMINHWDNMDGSIERGYAGNSIFYKDDQILADSERIKDYARLLASVGINAIAVNNVNVHKTETKLITDQYLPEVAKLASVFRKYGIKTFLSINFASPMELGGLPTADPLNPQVQNWWKEKAQEIYNEIADFGGFLIKADSEHRPGPFTYNRNHADGANMLAEALQPFGGIVIWRCFVYNCLQDWRDRKTDRARAAYDHFRPLNGMFLDNVILQIKNGPMDFQVREPVSPLFGAMPDTNQMLEFQITQEYTGQQKHVCYLVPQWKEVLDFDTYAKGQESFVKRSVDGSLYGNKHGGITAVANIGDNWNWTGHTLAQANLYGYGRLAWNPDYSEEMITEEWVAQTFGTDEAVMLQVCDMLRKSWSIYEAYTSPLGVGWMVNPGHHYGPNIDGYEYSVWGTYHFADCNGIGVNRTAKDGTGYTSQYFKENYKLYESMETCPDELLLFFHHVPYKHVLQSGETVIQHIYNTHFEGVEQVERLMQDWQKLKGKINEERFTGVLHRLSVQLSDAKEWRDIVNSYFFRKSGIGDNKHRTIY
ncbi:MULTISPECIES: alpha-glucuronidase family glycosyl hydrolase [unclassified Niallia]|uniref:alpha-glucuronidase family glycosyl hydrolase n=1 Tax=unclassified Niallia TaxID=2837522 RepID=UPI001EDA87F5|nr:MULTISPECIES: alpha-glucuronidase family glycosyl hydrolase [unclassified Niallia]MDL0436444.1 alpha-glucuronidase family glycosyl hydrolase [Niallia sp. SS-2023]UPO88661.1 alpha-glucuronidase [Niallia sp. Man26]